MAVSESNMAEFKIAAIIKLSQNESESDWISLSQSFELAESKMSQELAAIIQLSKIKLNPIWKWQNSRWQNTRWLPSSS